MAQSAVQKSDRSQEQLLQQRKLQEEEAERKKAELSEQRKRQETFFLALIDTAGIIAQNCTRFKNLLETHFESLLDRESTARKFFDDVVELLHKTTTRLMNTLNENVRASNSILDVFSSSLYYSIGFEY